MADLFDMRVGGAGWHITSHLIAIAALFVACFAIAGYITFRDDSVPGSALKDHSVDFSVIDGDTLNLSGDATIGGDLTVQNVLFPEKPFYLTENIEGTLTTLDQVTTPVRDLFEYAKYFRSFNLPSLSATQASLFMTSTSTVRRVDLSSGTPQTYSAANETVLLRGSVPTGGLTMTAGAALAQNNEILIIFEEDVSMANGVSLVLQTDQTDKFDSTGVEIISSGNGTDVFTRATVTAADAADQITIAATGTPTILKGSYIYMNAETDANKVIPKGCIRVTGGTVAITC